MAFVDEMTIRAAAGRGGGGVVRWLHLKAKEFSGPAGGDGGDGGDIYVRAVPDLGLLSRYRGEKTFKAGDGRPGEGSSRAGARGADLYVDVPQGSIVTNEQTGENFELVKDGQTALILKGGRGGVGNAAFKSSVNRSPRQSTPGAAGEEAMLSIELRLIADAGLVGLPNAGKTTLLNALAGTQAKTGSYAFTTLDPNLGALYGFVLADIPGLIEGASAGKGLGMKFLRHIARTRLILHCISLESEDPMRDYRVVHGELGKWGEELDRKPEMLILTKSDTRDAPQIKEISARMASLREEIEVVTVLDDEAVKRLRDRLIERLRADSQDAA